MTARIYVGTLTVANGVVIVDIELNTSMLGLYGHVVLTTTANGETEKIESPLPPDLIQEDMSLAIRAAMAFGISHMYFLGHVGPVEYIHHGVFNEDDLEPLIAHGNQYQQLRNMASSLSLH